MSQDTLEEIIELIRYGIENRNWASVEEALEYLIEDGEDSILEDEDSSDEDKE